VERLLAEAVEDPTLRLAYRLPTGWFDLDGRSVDLERAARERAVAPIDCAGLPPAAVLFDRELSDQTHFITAAAEAALMALDRSALQQRVDAESRDLAAARREAMDAAVEERRRIMRDLHDGAQQQLLGIQMKLALAQRRLAAEPGEVDSLMAEMRCELDDAIQDMRALARGAYPPLLADFGLERALARFGEEHPDTVTLRLRTPRRYPACVEAAVYFATLEALQNAVKHAHSEMPSAVEVWEDGGVLRFEITDGGEGFELQQARLGNGILSMCERVEDLGGALSVASAPGRGTVVSGCVPVWQSRRDGIKQGAGIGGRNDDTQP
jgi:signal transduction histidine kinase